MPVNTLKSDRDKIGLEDLTGDEINPATEETLQSIAGLVTEPYNTVEVQYTDATKEVISSVVYKMGATVVATITATYPTTSKEIYTTL
jgi:hypothetical protein